MWNIISIFHGNGLLALEGWGTAQVLSASFEDTKSDVSKLLNGSETHLNF